MLRAPLRAHSTVAAGGFERGGRVVGRHPGALAGPADVGARGRRIDLVGDARHQIGVLDQTPGGCGG